MFLLPPMAVCVVASFMQAQRSCGLAESKISLLIHLKIIKGKEKMIHLVIITRAVSPIVHIVQIPSCESTSVRFKFSTKKVLNQY